MSLRRQIFGKRVRLRVANARPTEQNFVDCILRQMSCAMKLQLASEYEAATAMFSKAVAELRRNETVTELDF